MTLGIPGMFSWAAVAAAVTGTLVFGHCLAVLAVKGPQYLFVSLKIGRFGQTFMTIHRVT